MSAQRLREASSVNAHCDFRQSPRRFPRFIGLQALSLSLFQINRVLSDLIEGGHRFGIGFECSLGHDEICEFGRDVHVGEFKARPPVPADPTTACKWSKLKCNQGEP